MKLSKVLPFIGLVLPVVRAVYSGDIVQYWVDQSAILVNGTIIGGLQSPPSGWYDAIVQGAVLLAANATQSQPLDFQQLAVSHAAHNVLQWTFHGTRLYATVDAKLAFVLPLINISETSTAGLAARTIGRASGRTATSARAEDGIDDYYSWTPLKGDPGNYQQTVNGLSIPDTPQARYIRLFGGVGNVTRFRAPPPPNALSKEYEKFVVQVKTQGARNSTVRKAYDTETAYFWRESSPIGWNRLAHAVIKNTLAKDVLKSAKFYAQLNYALANAGIASWDSKYTYNYWRPETAIRRPGIWLASGLNVSDPDFTPLLLPTPNHQDYVSTHATFGGAAARVIAAYNGGDKIDALLSSNVTVDNVGVITRRITSLSAAAKENEDSRVFGGIHFQYASDAGTQVGDAVANETLRLFDAHWAEL